MIILDTNVMSELMKTLPDKVVFDWVASFPKASVYTTAISVGEIRYGIAILYSGKRRRDLHEEAEEMFVVDFADRILPFDHAAAEAYATIAADRRQRGQPISQSDAQIAGIVRSRGAILATRNARDFRDCGFDVIDPWSTPPRSAPASPPR
ncbi:type II toxin-antitoxin system VapC family toxin [Beijerinckia sp. L45]|uniref:type II toxin-antitoxin system VapC family toxin n=1 Tax=Beijerinckia sp. L45 TaxID=1641855 RepID=UPI00131A697D|nr:type II toxin-antitoxin system VapC family toxin [Beijerinckia sp. L45]